MSENLFTVPKSYLEIALDQVAFENWLADRLDDDPETLTSEEVGERFWQIKQNEKQLLRRRARWIARAKNKDEQISTDLKVRILAQHAAREGSPLLFRALQTEGENLNPKHYKGAQCSACGSRIRYLSNGACVACIKRHNKSPWGRANKKAHASSRRYKDHRAEKDREHYRSDPEYRRARSERAKREYQAKKKSGRVSHGSSH